MLSAPRRWAHPWWMCCGPQPDHGHVAPLRRLRAAMFSYLQRVRKVATIPLGVVYPPPDNTAVVELSDVPPIGRGGVSTRSAIPAPSPVSDAALAQPGVPHLQPPICPHLALARFYSLLIIERLEIAPAKRLRLP